jgi:Na+-transporting NADH:ubiquinone oxidoreductase subunit B
MLRKFLDSQLERSKDEASFLHRFHPLIQALDTFLYEPSLKTGKAPHIRDAIDLKRWMMVVVFALIPCIVVAIWNSGVQQLVYTSGNFQLMDEFCQSSHSLTDYFHFTMKEGRYWTILKLGMLAYLPVMIISYTVGGICEAFFAIVRKHDIAEGFLVTGMLYALVLPPTIPYWMVAIGVAVGVVLSKELFGGTGMNIMNPALCCRAFLFFTFPGQMSGDVWVGTNPTVVRESLIKMNREANKSSFDGYTQATALQRFNIPSEIKRVQVDAIAAHAGLEVYTMPVIQKQYEAWSSANNKTKSLRELSEEDLRDFVTATPDAGGLQLSPDNFENAARFASVQYGQGMQTDWNFFLGNKLGCFGETSILACLIGAIILIYTRIGSWRTMVGVVLGAYLTAFFFECIATMTGSDEGAWNSAILSLPAYKHLLIGGFAFGTVFMATDPVSSASIEAARWIYGFLIGVIVIFIRCVNPAYPEGMMLAILTGNVFASLIDHYVGIGYRRFARA